MMTMLASSLATKIARVFTWSCGNRWSRHTGRPTPSGQWPNQGSSLRCLLRRALLVPAPYIHYPFPTSPQSLHSLPALSHSPQGCHYLSLSLNHRHRLRSSHKPMNPLPGGLGKKPLESKHGDWSLGSPEPTEILGLHGGPRGIPT